MYPDNWYGWRDPDKPMSPQEMRKVINRAMYHDPIARRCYDIALQEGLNGEDRMTVLAYYALRAVETMQASLFEKAMHSTEHFQPKEKQ